MRRTGNYRNWVKAKFRHAFCFYVGKQLERYGVQLDYGADVIAYGQTAGQAWRRAYEKCMREGWL